MGRHYQQFWNVTMCMAALMAALIYWHDIIPESQRVHEAGMLASLAILILLEGPVTTRKFWAQVMRGILLAVTLLCGGSLIYSVI